MMKKTQPTLITKKDAASILSCSVRTIERLVNKDELRLVNINRKVVRLVKSDVEEFLNERIAASQQG